MIFFGQLMHCFDTYYRKIKPRYFFKHIYMYLHFSRRGNVLKLQYRKDYDYDLFYVFSQRFTPKNLKKIKYANQQLREVSRKRNIVLQLYYIETAFDVQLMNMLFDGVKIIIEHVYNIEYIPHTAQYNKLVLNTWDLQKNDIIFWVEQLMNLGVSEIQLDKCDNAEKILSYLEDVDKTVTVYNYIYIKLH